MYNSNNEIILINYIFCACPKTILTGQQWIYCLVDTMEHTPGVLYQSSIFKII